MPQILLCPCFWDCHWNTFLKIMSKSQYFSHSHAITPTKWEDFLIPIVAHTPLVGGRDCFGLFWERWKNNLSAFLLAMVLESYIFILSQIDYAGTLRLLCLLTHSTNFFLDCTHGWGSQLHLMIYFCLFCSGKALFFESPFLILIISIFLRNLWCPSVQEARPKMLFPSQDTKVFFQI